MVTVDYSKDSLLTEQAINMLKERYMLPDEKSPQDAFARAAKAFASNDKHAQRIYNYVSNLWFMYATPILSNGGTSRGLPISCFLNYVEDSRKGISSHIDENIWLSTSGGGIGGCWSAIRTDGTATSKGSASTGMIPFLHTVDSLMLASNQGNTRRGSYASYLDISHPEIVEFITMRKPTGGDIHRKNLNIHHGVNIPDWFMKKIESKLSDKDYDDTFALVDPHSLEEREVVSAMEIWQLLLETRAETGEPFIHFIDSSNRHLHPAYKDQARYVKQSNLCCVTPDTTILTKEFGEDWISNYEDEEVEIWNGAEWSKVTVKNTGRDKVVKVVLSDYQEIECTLNHKFYVQRGYTGRGKVECVEAKDLKPGDKLEKWSLPKAMSFGIDDPGADAYSQGFYSGDGNSGLNHSWLYSTKYMCQNRLVGSFGEEHNSSKRKTWTHGKLLNKDFVPTSATIDYRINWLAGLYDADGTVVKNGTSYGLQLASINLSFLKEIRSMLITLGVHSKITLNKKEQYRKMPDGRGGSSEYLCQEIYRILIAGNELQKLVNLGIKFERLKLPKTLYHNRSALRFTTVKEIIDEGKVSDTFCFKEYKRSRGMFNGIVTGNSEILIPTDAETTAVCCLSSVNLEKYDEWKDTQMVEDLVEFLDNVLESFIINAPNTIPKAIKGAYEGREIGIGAMGFYSYLQSKNIPFECAMALSINKNMFKNIKTKAYNKTVELAEERGMCPVIKQCSFSTTPMRNIQLLAVAPNSSSSVIANTSPSIEPYSANAYNEKSLSGSNLRTNKHLNLTDEQWSKVKDSLGSVQELDIPEDTKQVFKTAVELDQRWIIEHAAARQPYICQGQSTNLFFPADTSKNYFFDVHFLAWKKGLKTLYYCRSQAKHRVNNINQKFDRYNYKVNNNECLACEG